MKHEEILEQYLIFEKENRFEDEPQNLYEPINYILSLGGKKVRPVLTLLSASLFSDEYQKANSMAYALELFHNFTLIHDDVMDHADTRRGKETVHKKWDLATAILSGDEMLIRTFSRIHGIGKEHNYDFLPAFIDMATEVCKGQQSDMDFEKEQQVELPKYIEMIRLKTAVLLAAAMKFGAIISGADEETQELIYNYAIEVGIGFQMMDDYLDTYGGAGFGKRIGGDILEDKKTWLYIKAQENANKGQKAVMEQWLGETKNEDEKIEAIRSIYDDLGIPTLAKNQIKNYFDKGDQILETIESKGYKVDNLKVYVNWLSNRTV